MRISLLILFFSNILFSLTIENKYIISPSAISSLINNKRIYQYIEKNPHVFKKLNKKNFFDFIGLDEVKASKNSSYNKFYLFEYLDEKYIHIRIPVRLLKNELNLLDYKQIARKGGITSKGKYYILRFKKTINKDNFIYLSLDTGEKKEFVFRFDDEEIRYFLKYYSNLLFNKPDLFDSLSIGDNKITFTTNYTKKDFKVNYYLKDFIKINKSSIKSKNIEKRFLIQINNNLPPLRCENSNLLESIFIGDEEFVLQEETLTNNIYSLYTLSNQDKFNEYLSNKIFFVKMSSNLKENTHNISYTYKTSDISLHLNLPKNISYDIESKYISSFNSFRIKINDTTFDGYTNGKTTYAIQDNICDEKNLELNVINTRNYLEYKKWDMSINQENRSLTFTPKFNIYKISPIIYAPFLLKKQNKYVVNSMIDEESSIEGEVKYAYIHNNIRFQSKAIINPKTNTNLYFQYPKNSQIKDIIQKTKFIYNSNPVRVVSSKEEKIKFTANKANKIALVYFPTGNLNSFRKYFLRHFDCNQEVALDEEICFNYLADMENGMNSFLQNLRKNKIYIQMAYRKHTYKENDKKNLISFDQSNRVYEQASDEQVLGKSYDRYGWSLSDALKYDKSTFANYGLKNIDLIYFSNVNTDDKSTLSMLNNFGFNKVFLINFGHQISNTLSDFENITFINHKYNKRMQFGMKEFDVGVFKEILKQIK